MDGRDWRVPERRGDLYWVHHAGVSGQIYAVYESTAGVAAVVERGDDVWEGDPCAAEVYAGVAE
jgi:hypothetical protein